MHSINIIHSEHTTNLPQGFARSFIGLFNKMNRLEYSITHPIRTCCYLTIDVLRLCRTTRTGFTGTITDFTGAAVHGPQVMNIKLLDELVGGIYLKTFNPLI